MDLTELKEHMEDCSKLVRISEEYLVKRRECADNKIRLENILTAVLPKIRAIKSSVGYDMSFLILLEEGFMAEEQRKECYGYYRHWKTAEAHYKGLEKIMDALRTKISFAQSYMKYIEEND